jgi:hypothetical protein
MSNKPNMRRENPMPQMQPAIQIFVSSDGSMQVNHMDDVAMSVKVLLMAADMLMTQKMQPKEKPMVEVSSLLDMPGKLMGRG